MLRFMGFAPSRDARGDLEAMNFLAGQSAGLVHDIRPAATIVRELVAEAERFIRERLVPVAAGPQSEHA